jgi:hypothetical protein
MWNRVAFTMCALMLGMSAPLDVEAQDAPPSGLETNSGPIIPFLEGTDVFSPLRDDVVFEADVFPHLFVYQDFTDILDVDDVDSKGRRRPRIVVSGTPAVRLRMFEEISRPVRTPSYMPRGNVQFIWARNVPAALANIRVQRPADIKLFEAHVIVGHHSNGQDGCLYTNQRREGETCIDVPGERAVNREDGSFSTNYIRAGGNVRFNYLDGNGWASKEWGLLGEVEYHPRPWVDDDIEDIYGRTRFNVGGSWAIREAPMCRRRLEAEASAQVIVGAPDEVWPVVVKTQISCFPFPRGGWGFFVRYYGGQDYYNLGFLENIQRVHVGATFNHTGFFRFRRPQQEAAAITRP